MSSAARLGKRLFVLDTNVLLHDPTALFRFKEHDIYVPMMVLEELDAAKKGVSEVARNARQVSRFLDGLIDDADRHAIEAGLALPAPAAGMAGVPPSGRLYLQTSPLPAAGALALPGKTPDNSILNTALSLKGQHPTMDVTLVSKDINLRIKSRVIGISAEDYFNDQVLDDINLLYTGTRELQAGFWDTQGAELKCWQEESRTFYSLPATRFEHFYPNEFLYGPGKDDL